MVQQVVDPSLVHGISQEMHQGSIQGIIANDPFFPFPEPLFIENVELFDELHEGRQGVGWAIVLLEDALEYDKPIGKRHGVVLLGSFLQGRGEGNGNRLIRQCVVVDRKTAKYLGGHEGHGDDDLEDTIVLTNAGKVLVGAEDNACALFL